MLEKLYIYYTNDLHSNFGQWSRVATFLKGVKAKRKQAGETYWFADIGDHVDRVHPIAEAYRGKANVQLLNELNYDVVTLGNNEGITLSREDLYDLYDDARFHVVCANLSSTYDNSPTWLQPTVTIQAMNGVKVGFIGLTAPFNDYYHLLGWHVANPYEILTHYVKELEKQSDIIVVLSHLGLSEDEEIARRFPAVDVIIGGHTHHLLRTGKKMNNTLLTAAGKHCSYVGEVILTWNLNTNQLVNKEAYAIDITHVAEDEQTNVQLEELVKGAKDRLRETIVHTTEQIKVDWFKDTTIMQQLTDTMLEWTEADCALLNAGILVGDFPVGEITYEDVHRICPHPINPCVVELTGSELMEVIRVALTKEFIHFQLKGFGFRGEVLGRMAFSGLTVKTSFYSDGQEYVEEVLFNQKPMRGEQTYKVATADAFTFGRLLPEIARSEVKNYFLPEFLRDLLVDTLKKNYSNE